MIQKGSLVHLKDVDKGYSQPFRVTLVLPNNRIKVEFIEGVSYTKSKLYFQISSYPMQDVIEDNGEYQIYLRQEKLKRILDE